MAHPYVEDFEQCLGEMLREVDSILETRYPKRFDRHPSRVPHGATANPQYDGSFALSGAFSAGIGSKLGPGYVLEIRIATLSDVHIDERTLIENEAVAMIRERLPKFFPARRLQVERDGNVWKIFGDLGVRPVHEPLSRNEESTWDQTKQ